MEVAGTGQWRREWAGTAEYGKVTEGGVTRRVARAMEVLNASAPGARMRVVRAAYHQSAGAGAPAASYLMHASRTVISSGFNLLDRATHPSPLFPSKPLEISSTPLESSPEPNTDTENYKVTEPDDFEISEPSKWKSATGRSSIRMPSEDSSSTDNASIIDLDARYRNIHRKYSYDSENNDVLLSRRSSSRASPLLDNPVALSTLKYKSLLNGSNDWNNRRKSYSFEDTSPLSETISHSNDTLAMESSTDSGICKSTEIVNDQNDKHMDEKEKSYDRQEETFRDWLFKNRSSTPFYKGNQFKSYKPDVVIEESTENNIALHSNRKVSIRTVPMTVADDYQYKDDADRRTKKVGFSKTELHFTPDSGKVNIIETDEKPAPSTDFRKRRSAFVPMHGTGDKPITLFGDNTRTSLFTNTTNEISEFEENTAATKSILKNKIPKPKPYLLGENMVFGTSSDTSNKDTSYDSAPTGVSLINKQLQTERCSNDTTPSFSTENNPSVLNKMYRTTNTGPINIDSLKLRKSAFESIISAHSHVQDTKTSTAVKNKYKVTDTSSSDKGFKSRQLRNSDLAYFGINNNDKFEDNLKRDSRSASSSIDNLFQSVRLVQSVTNSACNSETESEDKPEYMNLPIKSNFAPIPTPRPRSKYNTDIKELKMLRPIIEQDSSTNVNVSETRRSRLRRPEETTHLRSISEPRTSGRSNYLEKPQRRNDYLRSNKPSLTEKELPRGEIKEEEEPTYVNYNVEDMNHETTPQRSNSIRYEADKSRTKEKPKIIKEKTEHVRTRSRNNDKHYEEKVKTQEKAELHKARLRHHDKQYEDRVNTLDKKQRNENELELRRLRKIRTEKLATPEYNNEQPRLISKSSSINKSSGFKRHGTARNSKNESHDHASLRHNTQSKPEECLVEEENKINTNKRDSKYKELSENDTAKYVTKPSKDKSDKRESSSTRRHSEKTSTVPKTKETNAIEIPLIPNTKSDDYKLSKRSTEYVINYDDKKGTVSSICKVKPGSGTSKNKKVLKEKTKEVTKDNRAKNKTTEKIALLQLPDHQWDPYEMNYTENKWKRKLHAQRSCQIL